MMQRERVTWLAYLMLALYSYFLNVFGPITPYIKSELQLSYTVSSLHFSAFALGMICAGLLGGRVVQRVGRAAALWISALGISLGSIVLIAARSSVLTIGASFFMGLVGSLVLTVIPSVLADQHGDLSAVAFSEANVAASLLSAVAPILVGWFAVTVVGWRFAIVMAVIATAVLWLIFGHISFPPMKAASNSKAGRGRLPAIYWVYWSAIIAAVSVEFCMIFWSADYLETGLGMPKAAAAQAVSLFLAGMILGRLASSRLAARLGAHRFVTISLLLACAGFLLYWTASVPLMGLVGLFVSGLGVASLYPLILSLAIASAGSGTVQASAFSSLASGVAILFLPLVLGRLADALGIHAAYIVVLVLLMIAFVLMQATQRMAAARAT